MPIPFMQKIDVDMVALQALQARFAFMDDVKARQALFIGARAHAETHFGSHEKLV